MENRWQFGMEEFRSVQELVRGERYYEALERAESALYGGRLGRRYAARLHSLICWIHIALEDPTPAAVLHGEEAVRLAGLLKDEWIFCEAMVRLIPAYCQIGDLERAEQGCEMLFQEVERNEMVIPSGWAGFWSLRAQVALAAGDLERAEECLDRAAEETDLNEPSAAEQIRRQREAIQGWGGLAGDGNQAHRVRSTAVEALQASRNNGAMAAVQAREALNRAIAIGRADLARQLRQRLAHLL